jgi:hypothetical protein
VERNPFLGPQAAAGRKLGDALVELGELIVDRLQLLPCLERDDRLSFVPFPLRVLIPTVASRSARLRACAHTSA